MLTPETTAPEEIDAPVTLFTFSLSTAGGMRPANWSVKDFSFVFAPKPAVSEKFGPPTLMPVTAPFRSTPTTSSISPP